MSIIPFKLTTLKPMKGLLILTLVLLLSCKKKQESIVVKTNSITESVYASGKIKAVDQYYMYSTVNGVLLNVPVNIGDEVKQGQTIFEIDNTTSKLNSENARLALNLSSENNRSGSDKLKEMELNIRATKEKLDLDSSLFFRQKNLWTQNVGTEMDFEQKELAYTNSKNNYQTLVSKLNQLKTALKNEENRSLNNYTISQKQNGDYFIKSLIDGKVYDILKKKGELVTTQTPLAVIGKPDAFILELLVDENDIIKIKVGQKILTTMDSYKGEVLEAVVDKIYPFMNERMRTFTVEAHFTAPPKILFPNLSVEANIVIQNKTNCITIPSNYIVEGKYVLDENLQKKEIKVGLKNYNETEILSGLTINEIIYKPQ